MCEPTWWQMASPAWLFRAKPANYMDRDGGICLGLLFMPGLLALFFLHFVGLGMPIHFLLHLGWHPILLVPTVPVLLLWAVLIPADVKFRLQGATAEQPWAFDLHFIRWFGFVTLPLSALAGVAGLGWWLVPQFV